jgi:hypothetical protein
MHHKYHTAGQGLNPGFRNKGRATDDMIHGTVVCRKEQHGCQQINLKSNVHSYYISTYDITSYSLADTNTDNMIRPKLAIINLIPGTFLVPNLTQDFTKTHPDW